VTENPKTALAGVRVLDLTQFEAGPACTEALAWLGAEVVKVENPDGGDQVRRAASEDGETDSPFFILYNANKQSVTCNLKSPEGRQLVKDLAAKVDVVVENFGPGVLERFGLGYEDIRTVNPSVIYAELKGFAEGSPYENFLAFDMIGQASGGIMSITGESDGKPIKPGPNLADTGTGMLLAISILGALYQKLATGEGQRLTVAMQDAMMHYARFAFSDVILKGQAPGRAAEGFLTGGNAPMGVFPCAPGGLNDYVYIFVSRGNNRQWHRLLELIGQPDLIGDDRYDAAADRFARKDEIEAMLVPWTTQRTKVQAMEEMGRAGIPAGAVFDLKELADQPDFEERGIFQWVDHPVRGRMKLLGWPVKMSGSAVALESAPLLGEHTETVLGDWLGLSPDAVKALRDKGAV
jgi:formyl-CoA transferase